MEADRMRDIIVTLLVFGSLPFILRNAYVGVLVWSWLSYMNPHRLSWGFAYSMPFAQVVAITTFTAFIFSASKNKFPVNSLTVTWVLFLLWMGVTTFFALYPEDAQLLFIKILKIQAITFLTILLMNDQKKIDSLIWVIVLSIGFFSTKGGLFTIMTGGAFRVYGPPSSFIEENNGLALATLMIIPLMFYLYKCADHKWVRYGLVGAMVLSLASVLGSQSRGALIAIVAVGGFFWFKTNTKIVSGMIIVFLAAIGFNFMPESWHERMETIQSYEEDASAMGRINAWGYSINIANSRLTGGGLQSWKAESFSIYAPNPDDVHAAHSIFFGPMGDHGWPGLIMFVIILLFSWKYLKQVEKNTDGVLQYESQHLLAKMLQISLIAYMAGGAFLSLTYFDLPWHIIAITILIRAQVIDGLKKISDVGAAASRGVEAR